MIFDTHCHPHLNKQKNTQKTISEYFKNGSKYMNIIGTDPKTNQQVLDLAKNNPGVYCSIGIHPCDIGELKLEPTIQTLHKQFQENKDIVIAIGESGLDYHWMFKDAEKLFGRKQELKDKYIEQTKQLEQVFFKAHILLAQELQLPLVIHNREAKEDVLKILQEMNFKNFIFHCYSENLEFAQRLIDFSPNCKLSFSGITTFKNAQDIQQTAKNIALENIICETDSPYLTPVPLRGKEENEALFTKYVIEYISELRSEDTETVKAQIFQNSCDIFGLNPSLDGAKENNIADS